MSSMSNSTTESGVRRKNVRLALILASVVIVFFVGFVIKIAVLGKA